MTWNSGKYSGKSCDEFQTKTAVFLLLFTVLPLPSRLWWYDIYSPTILISRPIQLLHCARNCILSMEPNTHGLVGFLLIWQLASVQAIRCEVKFECTGKSVILRHTVNRLRFNHNGSTCALYPTLTGWMKQLSTECSNHGEFIQIKILQYSEQRQNLAA